MEDGNGIRGNYDGMQVGANRGWERLAKTSEMVYKEGNSTRMCTIFQLVVYQKAKKRNFQNSE